MALVVDMVVLVVLVVLLVLVLLVVLLVLQKGSTKKQFVFVRRLRRRGRWTLVIVAEDRGG